MTVKEASAQLWFFESHNNAKRSQWLQSTLSELEDKTKGMLKLIEGDADTFAQKAEMYYKKRPELINLIEDFYRSYRSLAESYDQLKLESGNSVSNQGFSLTDRSFTNGSLTSSFVTSDSDIESEVDDPIQEIESDLKETQVKKHTEKKGEIYVVKLMVEEVKIKKNILFEDNDIDEVPVRSEEGKAHGDIELVKLTHSESDFKITCLSYPEFDLDTKSEICVVKPMIEVTENYMENEVKRLKREIASYKVELAQKDEEKREVIRQLSASVDILKGENDIMKTFIRDSKNRSKIFELGKLKDVFYKFRFPTPLVAV